MEEFVEQQLYKAVSLTISKRQIKTQKTIWLMETRQIPNSNTRSVEHPLGSLLFLSMLHKVASQFVKGSKKLMWSINLKIKLKKCS